MASDAEMRRIILHAAEQLSGVPDLRQFVPNLGTSSREAYGNALLAHAVANSYAVAVLRMVATCLADDEPAGGPEGNSAAGGVALNHSTTGNV